MVTTIKEAKQRNMVIKREVKFIAIDKDSSIHYLVQDDFNEDVNSKLDNYRMMQRELTELKSFIEGAAKNMIKMVKSV